MKILVDFIKMKRNVKVPEDKILHHMEYVIKDTKQNGHLRYLAVGENGGVYGKSIENLMKSLENGCYAKFKCTLVK